VLSTLYPEHNWLPWKFDRVPNRFWEDQINQRKFIEWLSAELNITDNSQWSTVTTASVALNGGLFLDFHTYGIRKRITQNV
jgi:hypothetical protein